MSAKKNVSFVTAMSDDAIEMQVRGRKSARQSISAAQVKSSGGTKTAVRTKTPTQTKTVYVESSPKPEKSALKRILDFADKHVVWILIIIFIAWVIYAGYSSGFFTCKNSKGEEVDFCIGKIGDFAEKFGIGLAILGLLGVFLPFAFKKAYERYKKRKEEEEGNDPVDGGGGGGGNNGVSDDGITDDPDPPDPPDPIEAI